MCGPITYIITPQRTYYLCAIMDLCGRCIVAYRLGTEINATLVSDTVRDAFGREKGKVADGLLLHSDQGCQYTSEEYFAFTQEYHFSASMSDGDAPTITQSWKTSLVHSRLNAFTDANLLPANRFSNWSTSISISTTTNVLI